jgi:hypothetical protein
VLATSVATNQFQQIVVARLDLLTQTGVLDDLAVYYETNWTWAGVGPCSRSWQDVVMTVQLGSKLVESKANTI